LPDIARESDQNNTLREIERLDDVILAQANRSSRTAGAYTPSSGLLRLFEKTTWKMADRSGQSDLLILGSHEQHRAPRAEGNLRMTFPSTLLSPMRLKPPRAKRIR